MPPDYCTATAWPTALGCGGPFLLPAVPICQPPEWRRAAIIFLPCSLLNWVAGVGEMVGYAKRHMSRPRPSEDQRKFLELLRDGPRDNAQTAAVRKATKRACQVRGW